MRQLNQTYCTGTHSSIGGSFSSLSNERMSPVFSFKKPKQLALAGLLALLLIANTAWAQKEYTVGDTLPQLTWNNVLNYKWGSISTTSFKNDLLIIDFWATWCSSCIKGLSKLDSLRREFNFNVLLVNPAISGDDEQKINSFLEKRRSKGTPVRYPTLFKDSLLASMFPFNAVPHYIWLNKDRKILAITGAESVTAVNIRKALSGTGLDLPVKKDMLVAPASLASYIDSSSTKVFGAWFTSYVKEIPDNYFNSKINGRTKTLTWFNQSPYNLYTAAANLPQNRWQIRIKDTAAFYNKANAWEHLYSYELTLPITTPFLQQSVWMMQDLSKFLPYKATVEAKDTEVYTLQRIDTSLRMPSSAGKASLRVSDTAFTMRNSPVMKLISILDNYCLLPVIDETGLTQNIDLHIPESPRNLSAFIAALRKQNLVLIKTQKRIPLLLITDSSLQDNNHEIMKF